LDGTVILLLSFKKTEKMAKKITMKMMFKNNFRLKLRVFHKPTKNDFVQLFPEDIMVNTLVNK
jgi:hypothetical protein